MKPKKPKPISNLRKPLSGPKPLPGARKPLPGARAPLPGARPQAVTKTPAVQSSPSSGRYQTLMFDADRFFAEKDIQTAFDIYKKACEEAPPGENQCYAQACRCYRKLAKKALKKGEVQEVIRLLEEMLKLNGERPNLKAMDFKVLGKSYFDLKNFEKARESLERAMEIKPEIYQDIKNMLNEIKASELSQEFKNLY